MSKKPAYLPHKLVTGWLWFVLTSEHGENYCLLTTQPSFTEATWLLIILILMTSDVIGNAVYLPDKLTITAEEPGFESCAAMLNIRQVFSLCIAPVH